MSDKFVEILLRSNSYNAKISTASALNPMLWLLGLLGVPVLSACVMITIYSPESILPFMLIPIYGVIILCFLGIYIYFSIVKPENLRTSTEFYGRQ